MKHHPIRPIMVPLAEYATVPEDATLYDALTALRKAQQEFDQTRYRHRAVLVYDAGGSIIGKVSQLDVLKALEPKYDQIENGKIVSRFGYSPQFLKTMLDQFKLWEEPLDKICKKAAGMKVKDFMYKPTEGEFIEESAGLNEAVHQFVMGHHQSLLVTRDMKIVGILRVTDVFKEICEIIVTGHVET